MPQVAPAPVMRASTWRSARSLVRAVVCCDRGRLSPKAMRKKLRSISSSTFVLKGLGRSGTEPCRLERKLFRIYSHARTRTRARVHTCAHTRTRTQIRTQATAQPLVHRTQTQKPHTTHGYCGYCLTTKRAARTKTSTGQHRGRLQWPVECSPVE